MRSDYNTLIAKATGENLTFISSEGDYSLINSNRYSSALVVWTGLDTNSVTTCQGWTDSTSSDGLVGLSTTATTDWGVVTPMSCGSSQHLYCVQQTN